ncbi:glucose PTS transporter subunit EIIB [Rossellomorea sp. AcN35-11]|nr:glucose PTS transporter subunit EIIB [Rossellomorea sp. AcN35-11]
MVTENERSGENSKYHIMASHFMKDLGGKENLAVIDHCATRLRLEINDVSLVDEKALKAHGAKGVMKISNQNLQVIVGTDVEFVADELRKLK